MKSDTSRRSFVAMLLGICGASKVVASTVPTKEDKGEFLVFNPKIINRYPTVPPYRGDIWLEQMIGGTERYFMWDGYRWEPLSDNAVIGNVRYRTHECD